MKRLFLALALTWSLLTLTGMSKALKPVTSGVSYVVSKIVSLFGGSSRTGSSCIACEAASASVKTPPNGTQLPQWQYAPRGQTWTELSLAAIDREGLVNYSPKDATNYCPNWNKLTTDQRRLFWLQFSSKLSEIESGYNIGSTFTEPSGQDSNGLFSMSVGDCKGSPYALRTSADTYSEKKNIDCAFFRMRTLLQSDNYIGSDFHKGLGAYWGPLYPTGRYYSQNSANKKAILAYTRALPYCRFN